MEDKIAEVNDAALMLCLQQANELYEREQNASKLMRKGFMGLAKARRSMGRHSVSALDCRGELEAQLVVRVDSSSQPPSANNKASSSAAVVWGRHETVPATPARGRSPVAAAEDGDALPSRRRNAAREPEPEAPPSSMEGGGEASDRPAVKKPSDTLLLFGCALVSPHLRKAKQDFLASVDQLLAAANAANALLATVQKLERSQNTGNAEPSGESE